MEKIQVVYGGCLLVTEINGHNMVKCVENYLQFLAKI